MQYRFRKILYPLSILYKGITTLRNKLYDSGFIESNTFELPLIVVGNLRVGGTGKTPQVAYLVKLLKANYSVAVLSRGYKRKSKGFILADHTASAITIGDEPFQLFRQHPDILVAVDADRTNGINQLQNLNNPPDVIILDDAFQHRKVKAGLNILLTPYQDLYVNDTHLPSGNLRESITGASRAQIIVVSKSPQTLNYKDTSKTTKQLYLSVDQNIFFSGILYDSKVISKQDQLQITALKGYDVLLLTGIANPKPLVAFLKKNQITHQHISFSDHYNYTDTDIEKINTRFRAIVNKKKILLTTEKDYVRIFERLDNLYYLGIQTYFINHQSDFDKLILDYVGENARNR